MQLFLQPRVQSIEKWDGPRSGLDAAISYFNASTSSPITSFPAYLSTLLMDPNHPQLLSNANSLPLLDATHINFDKNALMTTRSPTLFTKVYTSSAKGSHFTCASTDTIMSQLRSVKTEAEINIMQLSGNISGHAFKDVLYNAYYIMMC